MQRTTVVYFACYCSVMYKMPFVWTKLYLTVNVTKIEEIRSVIVHSYTVVWTTVYEGTI